MRKESQSQMTKNQTPKPKVSHAQERLDRSNRYKSLRTIAQVAVLVFLVALLVAAIIHSTGLESVLSGASPSATPARSTQEGSRSFIAISYPGLTKSTSLSSKIVNQALFKEQINALKASGYVTIKQEDILNYYLYYGTLPEKALFIIFEDGLLNTTTLAQDTLNRNGYTATLCSYANNLNNINSKFITGPLLKSLSKVGTWEMGTNGYRLSYINVFDRYNNFFDQLNGEEFVKIHSYLWRDYNHYLMDFIRDEDRLRVETEEELRARIRADYDQLRDDYVAAAGSVPGLYILMHSNTGAFATDAIASEANRENIMSLFNMNFNREGTCLNTLDSSIYDLSRLQVQSYFSTNHLLMRIQDDIGEPMNFVTGDETEAKHWYLDAGAAQFKGNSIVLTSVPRGRGQLTLKSRLLSDLDMTVTLSGNLVGRQSISLRTDRNWEHGIEVALEDNVLEVLDLGLTGDAQILFRKSLFEFDGGPFISTQEDEHNGLIALQNAIIEFDADPARVTRATQRLAELEATPVLTLADGGTPYYPENDTSTREARKLRIRLVGGRMSIWVDDQSLVDQLKVPGVQLGAVSLGAEVFKNTDLRFTQHNIYDDVYDAVFSDLVISDPQNLDTVLYAYRLSPDQTINSILNGWFNAVIDFFVDHF